MPVILTVVAVIVPELKAYVGPLSVNVEAVILVMLVNVPPDQVNVPEVIVTAKFAKSMVPAVIVKAVSTCIAATDVIVPAVLIAMAVGRLPLSVAKPVPTMLNVAV